MIGSLPENLHPIKAVSQKAVPIRPQGLFHDLLKFYWGGRRFQKHPPLTLEADSTVDCGQATPLPLGHQGKNTTASGFYCIMVALSTNKLIVLCFALESIKGFRKGDWESPIGAAVQHKQPCVCMCSFISAQTLWTNGQCVTSTQFQEGGSLTSEWKWLLGHQLQGLHPHES